MSQIKISHHTTKQIIFWIFVISSLCYRAIIITNSHYFFSTADIIWYIGTIGFILYYGYEYFSEKKRLSNINASNLIRKVEKSDYFSRQDKEIISHLLHKLTSKTSKWQYLIVLIISIIAIFIDIIGHIKCWPLI
ncbi:MAG: hypothetical protein PHR00_02070 [Patescibacteria group bacterium]|nr:hypothetical protein [Patescibacteria group bacterium]